ncbi:hypothetical protein [Streptacidiphilus sp. PAMC 29251]
MTSTTGPHPTGPTGPHAGDPHSGAPQPGVPRFGSPGLIALADAAWQVLIAAGVVSVVLGIVVLVWPHATLAVVGVLFGSTW